MTDRTAEQILEAHVNRFKGGWRLVWNNLTKTEQLNLRAADFWRADLRDADLSGAYLRGANLSGANLENVNLSGAWLQDANLKHANLEGARFNSNFINGADFSSAQLSRGLAIVHGPTRSDGFQFSLRLCCLGEHLVDNGARSLTIEQYRQHVAEKYPNTAKADETLAILDYLEARRDQIFAEWSKS